MKAFEIKLSQGAKPGKGGVLPGGKVTSEIAATRGIPVGEASLSPNRHRDIANTHELLDQVALHPRRSRAGPSASRRPSADGGS